jgi:hypothetical protein
MCSLMPAPPRSYPVQVGGLIEQGIVHGRRFYRAIQKPHPTPHHWQRRSLWLHVAGLSLGRHGLTRGGCEVAGGSFRCGHVKTPYLAERDNIFGVAATSAVLLSPRFRKNVRWLCRLHRVYITSPSLSLAGQLQSDSVLCVVAHFSHWLFQAKCT